MRLPGGTLGLGVAATAVVHGALLAVLFEAAPPRLRHAHRHVKIRVSAPKPPPPTPVVAAVPAPEAPPAPAGKPRPPVARRARDARKPQQPAPAPPRSPAPVAPEAPAPAPRRFTASIEATVPGGGVAVGATPGGSGGPGAAWGTGTGPMPERPAASPSAAGPIDAAEATVLPRVLSQPSAAELEAFYPPAARREGIEAGVGLRLLVSATGEVTRVEVVRAAGRGFDEAAMTLARRLRFQPGQRGGRAVAIWIPWTYRFRVDG